MCSNISFVETNETLIHEETINGQRRSLDLISRNETEILQPHNNNSTTQLSNINKIKASTTQTTAETTTKTEEEPLTTTTTTTSNNKNDNKNKCNLSPIPNKHATPEICKENNCEENNSNTCPICTEKTNIYAVAHCNHHMIKFKCPIKSCQSSCDEGWTELVQHVRNVHKLIFCGRCIAHRKIFSWEHILYTKEELRRHYRSGDSKDTNFRGHPSCIESFSIPNDNKYFAYIIQTLDELTSSVFNINYDILGIKELVFNYDLDFLYNLWIGNI
ncbi:1665_t:CDS:2 [Diversispora eburnea]|uniref:1665_t:CDS:1 n=1 Tax=Diversispora eburnea TaxID=1213867 RepID=A0A9N8W842_9GLOM|nr:1665_t:CDS:2 [Diversispora eburnea]